MFQFTLAEGCIVPTNPEYWNVGKDIEVPIYLRCEWQEPKLIIWDVIPA